MQLLIMLVLYFSSLGIGMYTFLGLNEKPYIFAIFAPFIIILFLLYYLGFYISMNRTVSYKHEVNKILDEFEEEHKCKIRIRKHKKGFEINWSPMLNSKKGKEKGKGKQDSD